MTKDQLTEAVRKMHALNCGRFVDMMTLLSCKVKRGYEWQGREDIEQAVHFYQVADTSTDDMFWALDSDSYWIAAKGSPL